MNNSNTNSIWSNPDYDIPTLENEEMWSQRVIDDAAKYLVDEIEQDEK